MYKINGLPKEAFNKITNYDVKAYVADYTSVEVYVNINGKTTAFHADNDGSGIYQGLTFVETYEDFLDRVMNGSFVELNIIKA